MKRILISLLFILGLHGTLHAEIPTKENVTRLYVATFNRAPDAAGLNYWVNQSHLQLEQIAQSFFDQPETQEKYPAGTSGHDFVKAVYNNLFNRDPESGGWVYWEGELQSGRVPKPVFILAVINGAQDTQEYGLDRTILQNKKEVGLYFVQSGLNDVNWAKEVMADVTAEAQSVVDAKAMIDDLKNSEMRKNFPVIRSLVTDMGDANLSNVLSANHESKLSFTGLEESNIKLEINTANGKYKIIPSSVSIENNSIGFASPANVSAGKLSVIDIRGNVLTTIPYKIVTSQTPYLNTLMPDIANAGERVTIKGANLPSAPVKVVFEGQESSLTQTATPSNSNSVSFTVPQGAVSGSLYLQINQIETNRLQLTIKRNIDVEVTLGEGLDINASDISFVMGFQEHILDQNYQTTLRVENEEMQYLHAMVPFTDKNASLLYSAVVLPDMSGTVTVDANSTAVAWVFMGMGVSVTTPKEQLRTLYDSVSANEAVQAFADYIGTLQKDDFNAWAILSDTMLQTKFQDALRSVAEDSVRIRARMLSARAAEDNSLVKITQTPENDNIYLENRKSDGSVWIVNDTRLYLSVAVTSKEPDEEYNIEYKHPDSLSDMQFSKGIVGPKGWVWLGIASDKKFELEGIDSSLEIIAGAYNGETDKEKVATILKARAFLEGIIAPTTDMILSTLLDKGVPKENAWKHVIDGMYDIYGTNFVKQLQTSVSTQSNGWWALADTLVMMPLKRGMKGCLKRSKVTGLPAPDTWCKSTIKGLLNISGIAIYSYEDAYDEVMKKIKQEVKEQVIKSVVALIPVGGWIARSALFVWENASTAGKVLTMGETIVDMKANPPEINVDVEFALNITKVDPMCVVIPPNIGNQSYSFGITGEGFTAKEGDIPYVKLLIGDMEIESEDVTVFEEGTKILAQFSRPLDFITNGSQGDSSLFVGYNDGLYTMYPKWLRIIDPSDATVFFDTITPASAYNGATVTLKGCGWVPLDDIRVYFSKGLHEYVEAIVLSKTDDTIRVKVPTEAQSGTVYVTAGNKVTKKLFFDINPFSLDEPDEEEVLIKSEGYQKSLFGHALDQVSKIYFIDHTNKKIEGNIIQSDEDLLEVTIPEDLAYGPVRIYAENNEGIVSNEISMPLVPKGVDANPSSQGFTDTIQVTLTQEDHVDIYYRIDEGEEQKYSRPITLRAEDAKYEYFSLYTYAQVTINDVNYTSDELEYKYSPPIVCKDYEKLVDGECAYKYTCPLIYDPALDDDNEPSRIYIPSNRYAQHTECSYYTDSGQLYLEEMKSIVGIYDKVLNGRRRTYYNTEQINAETLQIHSEAFYIYGKRVGKSRIWYKTGKLIQEDSWVNGIRDGIWKRWYYSGKRKQEYSYVDGILNGLSKKWYESGSRMQEFIYVDGKIDGILRWWYKSGRLESRYTYVNGKKNGIAEHWYDLDSGQLESQVSYINGKKDGVEKSWYKSGKIHGNITYVNGKKNGIAKAWYESGFIASIRNYVDDKLDGKLKYYTERESEKMIDCEIYDMGTKTGSCMP